MTTGEIGGITGAKRKSPAGMCLLLWVALVGTLSGASCRPPENGIFGLCAPDGDLTPVTPVASNPPPTYAKDIRAIVAAKCVRCHQPEGLGPFPLDTYERLFAQRDLANHSIQTGEMPPWLPAHCCAPLLQDWSMTDEERALFAGWVAAGAPSGDLAGLGPSEATISILSRVDVTITLPKPYTPRPPAGRTDDTRCFVVDWPRDGASYITGFNTLPGTRSIVHHLLVAVVAKKDGQSLQATEGKDGQPGYSCNGGAFGAKVTRFVGGGLGGTEFPPGLGTLVPAGSKLLLQIHYSTANTTGVELSDRTSVQLRVDEVAREVKPIVVTNPFWFVGSTMLVHAGDRDAVYYYRYRPVIFTAGKRVQIQTFTPHMHTFGSKFLLGIIHSDGTKECLLEIPQWHFGWEQGYWLQTPRTLEPEDQLYVECHFDNSESRQPVVDGKHLPPRDFATGSDNQDMCAGMLGFTDE